MIDQIPGSWTDFILISKGVCAMVGVMLLLWHINHEWIRMQGDQRARYMLLLAYGVLSTGPPPNSCTRTSSCPIAI